MTATRAELAGSRRPVLPGSSPSVPDPRRHRPQNAGRQVSPTSSRGGSSRGCSWEVREVGGTGLGLPPVWTWPWAPKLSSLSRQRARARWEWVPPPTPAPAPPCHPAKAIVGTWRQGLHPRLFLKDTEVLRRCPGCRIPPGTSPGLEIVSPPWPLYETESRPGRAATLGGRTHPSASSLCLRCLPAASLNCTLKGS